MPIRRLLASLLLLCAPLAAHQIDEIPSELTIDGENVRLRLFVDAAYMIPEFRGDSGISAKDLAWLRELGPQGWQTVRQETETYFRDCLQLTDDGTPIPLAIRFLDFDTDPPVFVTESVPDELPMIEVLLEGSFHGSRLGLTWREPFDVVLIIQAPDETVPVISGETATLLERSAEATGVVAPPLGRWIRIGWDHILPSGLDHILFILGMFLLAAKWKPLLKQSLTFTLAHSLSLVFAALGWIDLPARPIDVGIALSISWIAIENFGKPRPGLRRYLLIAGFGLIHGLGFARWLAPLLPPDRPDALATGIIGFNLGVEAGQIAVLVIAFALVGWWKDENFRQVRIWGSLAIAVTGLVWAVERLL
jgi:hydrogenase/urease accessory protein HupE